MPALRVTVCGFAAPSNVTVLVPQLTAPEPVALRSPRNRKAPLPTVSVLAAPTVALPVTVAPAAPVNARLPVVIPSVPVTLNVVPATVTPPAPVIATIGNVSLESRVSACAAPPVKLKVPVTDDVSVPFV